VESIHASTSSGPGYPVWDAWPVNWSAIGVGALSALSSGLVFGLIGTAVSDGKAASRIVSWHDFGVLALVFGVLGTFFAFVIGGWVAGKIAGIWHAEPAMLHGAITWLVAVPLMLILGVLGAGHFFGGFGIGLSGIPAWVTPSASSATVDPSAAIAAKNAALAGLTALLIGLIGSAIGGWMSSGEPMTLTHHRQRNLQTLPS